MGLNKTLFFIVVLALLAIVAAVPDSAGIVEMEHGLAYGGIPYGSVSGMVAKYQQKPAGEARQIPYHGEPNVQLHSNAFFRNAPFPVVRGHTMQIYNHPGVVAPGVVGQISEIGWQ